MGFVIVFEMKKPNSHFVFSFDSVHFIIQSANDTFSFEKKCKTDVGKRCISCHNTNRQKQMSI